MITVKRSTNKAQIEAAILENGVDEYFTDWRGLKLRLITYEKGEYIQRLGEDLVALKLSVSGEFEVSSISWSGKQFILSKEKSPNFFGDMEFAAGLRRTTEMNAIALTEVICLELPLEDNEQILLSDAKFLRFLCRTIGKKALESSNHYEKMGLHSSEMRLMRFLLMNAREDVIELHFGDTSQRLGISYRQIMRLMSSFCERGLIKRGEKKGEYRIKDRKKIEDEFLP